MTEPSQRTSAAPFNGPIEIGLRALALLTEGVPANPSAWLVSAGRFRAIDSLRRRARFDAAAADLEIGRAHV